MALFLTTILALSPALVSPALAEATLAPSPTAGSYDEKHPENLTAEDLKGASAIVVDINTGRVLFEKNADKKLYPASTTKIMTALLALEYGHLDERVTVPKQITKLPKDSSLVPLKAGEKLPLIDLLYGLMLPSGNDAAVSIATFVAGSVDDFVAKMNQRAEELGCENTHFANPHGYQDEDHYTTARDLALIAREAMKNETFREIVSARSYTIAATAKSKKRKLTTTDDMLVESSPNYYPYEIGVKTGHHSKAGSCFVGAAQKDGVTLVSVTLKSSEKGVWTDTRRLMEYGFAQYQTYGFDDLYQASPLQAAIQNADGGDLDAGSVLLTVAPGGSIGNYTVTCLPDDLGTAAKELMGRASVQYTSNLTAPIREGDVLGTISLTAGDGSTLTGTLLASRGVEAAQAAATPVSEPTSEPAAMAAPKPAAAPASTPGQVASWVQTKDFSLLWLLMSLIALVILLIVLLRIRRAIRRRRYREMRRRQQHAAYARYRQAR